MNTVPMTIRTRNPVSRECKAAIVVCIQLVVMGVLQTIFAAEFVPGEVLVIVSSEAKPNDVRPLKQQLDEVDAALPGKVTKSLALGSAKIVKRVKLRAGMTVPQAVRNRAAHLRVLVVEPNYILRGDATIPNDPRFTQQWGLHNTGTQIQPSVAGADIHAPEAWDITTGSPAVVVAIVDSGMRLTHQDLAPNLFNGWNFIDDNNDPTDLNGHGTHVAGIIGARGNNGVAGAGVAWNVRLMPCRYLDAANQGDSMHAAEAIQYAVDNGAKIINFSSGGDGDSQVLHNAIAYAGSHGVLFVCSAGNNGRNIDQTPYYPSSYSDANIVSVASLDADDRLSSFSNFGATSVHLGAPGDLILSTSFSGDTNTEYKSGTSMATPFVAGTAALMLSVNSSMTVSQLKTTLLTSGDAVAALSGKSVSGRRLNAFQAVVASLPPPPPPIWVDFSFLGTEQGTFDAPFNTLVEGVTAASAGGRVIIKAGSRPESITITKPLTLESFGGVATIGQ